MSVEISFSQGGGGGATNDFFRSGAAATTLPDGTTDLTDDIVHNGKIGVGDAVDFTNATTLAAALDVSGAEVLRSVTLANFAANAAIGTAAATVDIASTIIIPQTAVGIVLTLPNPTNAQNGRVLAVLNTGTAQVKVANQYITPGTAQSYVWSGAAWIPLGDNPDAVTVAANRNVAPGDHLKTLIATAAVTLTVPNTIGNYLLMRVRQQTAAATVTIAAGAGKVLVAPFGAVTAGAAGASMIVEVVGANVYVE